LNINTALDQIVSISSSLDSLIVNTETSISTFSSLKTDIADDEKSLSSLRYNVDKTSRFIKNLEIKRDRMVMDYEKTKQGINGRERKVQEQFDEYVLALKEDYDGVKSDYDDKKRKLKVLSSRKF
jgi:hypothetical protein